MSNCLYCGRETNFAGSFFCRGHHRAYKKILLQELATGTISEVHMNQLRQFNWLPADYVAPVQEECVETPVKRTRTKKVKVVGTDVAFRKFGVELECVCPNGIDATIIDEVNGMGYKMVHTGYTHEDVPHWKSLYDGSVHPNSADYDTYQSKEYVSPAFSEESGLKEVADVCKVITDHGGYTNRTTGTHVHLDASDLTSVDIAKIVYLYGKLEGKINSLLPENRRKNSFCKSVKRFCKYVSYSGFEYFDNIQKLSRVLGTRYLKVNVDAYLRHGTVEFRQLNGTLDSELIKNWVKLCTRIVDYVKSGKDVMELRGNLYKILGCQQDEITFWNGVKERLAA